MKEINVLMLTTFKIIEEIQNNININLLDVNFGIFQIKLSLFKELDANLV